MDLSGGDGQGKINETEVMRQVSIHLILTLNNNVMLYGVYAIGCPATLSEVAAFVVGGICSVHWKPVQKKGFIFTKIWGILVVAVAASSRDAAGASILPGEHAVRPRKLAQEVVHALQIWHGLFQNTS
jgi:Na+/proline symporter